MMWRRAAAVLAAVVAALVLLAPQAVAATNPFSGLDCRTPPTPRSPATGLANDIDPGPAAPRDGDPFVANPSTTPYEAFGYGGTLYQRYDPGCLLDKLPGDVINGPGTNLANLQFTVSSAVVALAKASSDTVREFNTMMEPLYPVVSTTSNLLGEQVYYPFAALVVVALGIWLAVQARHADTRLVGRYLAGAVLAVVTAAMMLNYPIRAVQAYTNVVNTGVQYVDEVFAGDTGGVDPEVVAHAQLHEAAVLRPYLGGLVCSSSGPTYDRFATDLYSAATLTRQEDTVSRADPDGAGQQIRTDKTSTWQGLADEIETADPSAYDCLQGEREWEQAAFGFSSLTIGGTLGGAKIASNVLLMVAFLFGALVVALFPIIALFGIARVELLVAPFVKAAKMVGLALIVAVGVRLVSRMSLSIMDEAHPLLVAIIIVALLLAVAVGRWRSKKKKRRNNENRDRDRDRPRDRGGDSSEPSTPPQVVPVDTPTTWTPPDPRGQPELTPGTVHEGSPGTRVAGELPAPEPEYASWVYEPTRERHTPRGSIEGRRAIDSGVGASSAGSSTGGASHNSGGFRPNSGAGSTTSGPGATGPTGASQGGDDDGWVSAGPAPSTHSERPPVRVMDPGELLPAGVAERGYQKVYRPKEKTRG